MSSRSSWDWNPQSDSVIAQQRQAYDEMRERCPVAHSDFLGWSLFRHEDVTSVLADPKTYSSASTHHAVPNGMDQPEHTMYRRILDPYFHKDRMTAFEPECRRIAVEVLDNVLVRDDVEFVSTFADVFSLQSHCAFLGWHPDAWKRLLKWNQDNQHVAFSRDKDAGSALASAFADYVNDELHMRREAGVDGSDDVTSRLMLTKVNDATLSDDDIISVLRNWTAGHSTVAAALGIVVQYLADHVDEQQHLRSDPTMVPNAIEEILRVDGPLVANHRTAVHDVDIGGRIIRAGEKLSLMWIAANRDGQAFDKPDTVRFDRDTGANLLFGAGIHYCLGAPLARLEMRVATEEILARTSHIELTGSNPPQRAVYPSNGLQSMTIRCDQSQ